MRVLLLGCLCAVCGLVGWAAEPAKGNPWESAIVAFETADKAQFPPKGEILFTGSSTIAMWKTLAEDFAPLVTVRRGFGGSQISDLVYYADRIILPYEPRMVVVFSGGNDIAAGKSPETVFHDFQQLVTRIHATLPQTRIFFVSQHVAPSRAGFRTGLETLNALVQADTLQDPLVGYIDAASSLLDARGLSREELFLGDKLHLNAEGYKRYTAAITPYLCERSRVVRNLQAGQPQHIVTYGTSLTDGMPWVNGMRAALTKDFPGLVTVTNSGSGAKWSGWGLENLDDRVLQKKPDTVLIEFAINDAYTPYKTTVAQCRSNLETMIDRILAQHPRCEIILMTMNPPVREHLAARPHFAEYYQVYREVAKARGLLLIDHAPTWQALLDQQPETFNAYVPDGIHPNNAGNAQVILPAVLDALYGRPRLLSPQQARLELYRTSLRFSTAAPRGQTSTLTLPVTNTTPAPISFAATWTIPGTTASRITPAAVPVTTLAPGASRTFTFTLAATADLYQLPVLAWTITAGTATVSGKALVSLRSTGVYFTRGTKPPAAALLRGNQPEQVAIYFRERWGGPRDCSAVAWVKKERDAWRVRIEVTDDVLVAAGKQPWENDSVECYFDFRPAAARTGGNARGHFQLIAVPGFSTTAPNTVTQYGLAGVEIPGITVTSGTRKDGYWVELVIPFAGLRDTHGLPGEEFAFDFAVNDSDTPGAMKSQLHGSTGFSTLNTPGSWITLRPAR